MGPATAARPGDKLTRYTGQPSSSQTIPGEFQQTGSHGELVLALTPQEDSIREQQHPACGGMIDHRGVEVPENRIREVFGRDIAHLCPQLLMYGFNVAAES